MLNPDFIPENRPELHLVHYYSSNFYILGFKKTNVPLITFIFQNITGFSQTSPLPNELENQSLELPSQNHLWTLDCVHPGHVSWAHSPLWGRDFLPKTMALSPIWRLSLPSSPKVPPALHMCAWTPDSCLWFPFHLPVVLSPWPSAGQGRCWSL